MVKKLRKLKDVALAGGMTIEGSRLITNVRHPALLSGSIPGFIGIGIAGKVSDVSFDMITGRKRKRRRK